MKKRYVVRLTLEERNQLEGIIKRGREAAYRRRHAQVLLLVDEGNHGPRLTDTEASERTGFTRRTVEQIRERCVSEGLSKALGVCRTYPPRSLSDLGDCSEGKTV